MNGLLEAKEHIRSFYGKYEVYIVPVLKFMLAFATFFTIGKNVGYMNRINGLSVQLVLALLCAVLPSNLTVLFAMLLVVANLYALSLEVCVVAIMLFALVGLLFFRFTPRYGSFTLLTPLCFGLKIPYVIPISAGLLTEVYSVVSVMCGTVFYFFIHGVKENEVLLGKVEESDTAVSKFTVAINQLLGNREMYLVLVAFCVMSLVVYFIRRRSMDHAWTIAIAVGVTVEFLILFAGYVMLGITEKTLWLVLGNVISIAIGVVIKFFCFNLDYTRTERVQFEDDEYYYYVKAVPKIYVTTPEKQVKSISGSATDRERRMRISKDELAEEMDIDRDLLDS